MLAGSVDKVHAVIERARHEHLAKHPNLFFYFLLEDSGLVRWWRSVVLVDVRLGPVSFVTTLDSVPESCLPNLGGFGQLMKGKLNKYR